MAKITTTTWGEGFTTELSEKWDKYKDTFLNTQIEAGKVTGEARPLDSGKGGTREWADQESANGWKTLAETFASENNITVSVTIQ